MLDVIILTGVIVGVASIYAFNIRKEIRIEKESKINNSKTFMDSILDNPIYMTIQENITTINGLTII